MQNDYHIDDEELKVRIKTAGDRLALISELLTTPTFRKVPTEKERGRNIFTRTVDIGFALARKYAPPVHWLGVVLSAATLLLYVRLVALTARLVTTGEQRWPDIPAPCVLALWHRDAPSLLVAFAMRRPKRRSAIMISPDARGDCMALLCRLIGLEVVRGGGEDGGWQALTEIAKALAEGACAIITVDGGGPAWIAKVGAVALAYAGCVPLVPATADCQPAIQERHKWDAARIPLPFGSLRVRLGDARTLNPPIDGETIEHARRWLQETLDAFGKTDPIRDLRPPGDEEFGRSV
ncbi:MAG: lysophospholipid acyltransferase family protein [Pyrinomonadaceae bacterium]